MDFKMMLELYNPENDEHSIALSLPASDYQIQDALDQIRVYGENARCNISIAHCNVLPELVGARIDSQNVFEVNYFAHRLKNISENSDEYAVFIKDESPAYRTHHRLSIPPRRAWAAFARRVAGYRSREW